MTAPKIVRSPVARAIAGAVFGLIAGLLFGWTPPPKPFGPPVIPLLIGAVFLAVAWWVVNKPLPISLSRLAKGFLGGGAVGILMSAALPARDAVILLVLVIAALVFSQSEISGDPLPSHDRKSQRRP